MEDGNSSNALPEHVMEHDLSGHMKIGERLIPFQEFLAVSSFTSNFAQIDEGNGVMVEFVGGQTSGLFALDLYLGLSWMFAFIRLFAIPQYDDYKIEARSHWRLCGYFILHKGTGHMIRSWYVYY